MCTTYRDHLQLRRPAAAHSAVDLFADLAVRRSLLPLCRTLFRPRWPAPDHGHGCRLAGADHLPGVSAGALRVVLPSIGGAFLLAIGAVLCGVVTAVLLSEVFPTRSRYTASAITSNTTRHLFGGTAPLIATWLIERSGDPLSPAYYLAGIALFALAGGLSLPETAGRPEPRRRSTRQPLGIKTGPLGAPHLNNNHKTHVRIGSAAQLPSAFAITRSDAEWPV